MTDRMPLYPLVLAGIQSAFGSAPRAAAAAQAVLDAGTCTLIAALGTLISPLTGLIAGVLAAVSVTLVVFSTQLLTNTVFLFFTVMLLAGAHFLLRASMGAAALGGLAGRTGLATRPWIAPLLIAATPLIYGCDHQVPPSWRSLRHGGIVCNSRRGPDRSDFTAQRHSLRQLQSHVTGRKSPRLLDCAASEATRLRNALRD